MKSRFAVSAVAAAAAVLLLGGACGRRLDPPEFISVPSAIFAGDTAAVRLAASGRGYHSVRYVVDWDDASIETTELCALSDTAALWHVWTVAPDTKYVRAAAFAPEDTQGIRWAEQQMVFVDVGGSHAPVIDTAFIPAPVAVRGAAVPFTVRAHDPDGDSLRLVFQWSMTESTTVSAASPCSVTVNHVFAEVGTAVVIISVQDTRGALSQPDTIIIPVGLSGGVKWYWQSVEEGVFNTSPLCVYDGQDECVSAGCYWDEKFYSMKVQNGKLKRSACPRLSPYVFTGPAAFCAATQHFILGSEEGELYALGLDLSCAWRWPNAPSESLEPMVLFGAPAIRDNRIYVPRDDDSLYYFIDSIDHGVRVATFPAGTGIVDAPVIDVQGNVYFGTDSGYLCKVGSDLDTVYWRTQLVAGREIHSPVIGSSGVIYCSSGSGVFAIDPQAGVPLWTATTDGEPLRLAVTRTAIFLGTSAGRLYSISPATGSVNWYKSFTQSSEFKTAPIATANGFVYFQDDCDVLYCLYQLDGTLIWRCDCNGYLPGGTESPQPRRTGFPNYLRDPTITGTGDIIVAGQAAVFCVVGYPEGPLDPLAPWPKWQHDLYNTGYVGGGR
jgi:outer membrane protein assembly factor BamB